MANTPNPALTAEQRAEIQKRTNTELTGNGTWTEPGDWIWNARRDLAAYEATCTALEARAVEAEAENERLRYAMETYVLMRVELTDPEHPVIHGIYGSVYPEDVAYWAERLPQEMAMWDIPSGAIFADCKVQDDEIGTPVGTASMLSLRPVRFGFYDPSECTTQSAPAAEQGERAKPELDYVKCSVSDECPMCANEWCAQCLGKPCDHGVLERHMEWRYPTTSEPGAPVMPQVMPDGWAWREDGRNFELLDNKGNKRGRAFRVWGNGYCSVAFPVGYFDVEGRAIGDTAGTVSCWHTKPLSEAQSDVVAAVARLDEGSKES